MKICAAAHRMPDMETVRVLADLAELSDEGLDIDDRRIAVTGSSEQQRYFIQHSLNYQVHDQTLPHLEHRHGRAELGWS